MKPIYKSLALAAMTLQVSLTLNAETRDDENASTIALQAELLDSLRVELVAQNVSGARNLIESGECVINGSNLVIALDTGEWTRGAMYRVQVLATFGTQTQVIYALNVTVPYYIALSDVPQEFEDNVTIVSTITDVTEADLEGLALEETSQEIKAAITPISAAADAYNVGKTQLAAAITSKGVLTSPTESYPEMAEKVNAISQETYEINGGEMYAKQLFGSLVTPNYWNLYDVLAQLLSDGRLVNYGGILLAEYYRGYDNIALSGAGAGGAYVVSDKDSDGNFIMYTDDTTHTWATEFDGKGNRWVAYCFADEYHDFQITDTNTSPRSIFIGRKAGNITSFVNGCISKIVVPDGNELMGLSGNYKQQWDKRVVIRNIKNNTGTLFYSPSCESLYVEGDVIGGVIFYTSNEKFNISSIIVKCNSITASIISGSNVSGDQFANLSTICLYCPYIRIASRAITNVSSALPNTNLFIQTEDAIIDLANGYVFGGIKLFLKYITNDKTKGVFITNSTSQIFADTAELQNGWCKPVDLHHITRWNETDIYYGILQRLKQDEPDCGDGVTITLGATNLAKLTSEESVQLLDDLTNIYGYTFA